VVGITSIAAFAGRTFLKARRLIITDLPMEIYGCAADVLTFMLAGDDDEPNKALEPTADGAFILMSTDNITSPSSATPLSTAVAQLGR
jgi:hypothetical protein